MVRVEEERMGMEEERVRVEKERVLVEEERVVCPLGGRCVPMVREVGERLRATTSSTLFPLVPRLLGEQLLQLVGQVETMVQDVHEVQGVQELQDVQEVQGVKEVQKVQGVQGEHGGQPPEEVKIEIEEDEGTNEAVMTKVLEVDDANIEPELSLMRCEECDKTFIKQCNLTNHLKTHKVKGRTTTCPVCEKTIHRYSTKRHIRLRHPGQIENHLENLAIKGWVFENKKIKDVEKHSIECYSFGSFRKFEKLKDGSYKCPGCDENFKKWSIRKHVQ